MAAIQNGSLRPTSLATWDLVRGFTAWRLWAFLGLQDIRQRYRRSSLGPLWLALGLGVTVFGIGLLYTEIFKIAPGDYLPYIAISLLIWNFISALFIEGTVLFQNSLHVITSVQVPYTSFVLRALVRNLIVAAHSIVVVIIVFVWYRYEVSWAALAVIPGILLLCANMYWIVLLVGMMSARYRDLQQIINYAIGILFFLTPVIWTSSSIRPGSPYIVFNPLAQMVEVVRGPIFGRVVPAYSFVFLTVMLVVGMTVTLFVFYKSRRRLVYWI